MRKIKGVITDFSFSPPETSFFVKISDDPFPIPSSADDTPLLGGGEADSTTWTVGTDTIPTTIYVGADAPSETVGDIQFKLSAILPGETASSPSKPTATTAPASAIEVELETQNTPNGGDVGDDWSDQTEQWLVGQMVDLDAVVDGPSALTADSTFAWATQGKVFKSYNLVSSPTDPSLTPLAPSDLSGQELAFFWTDTGNETTTCNVTIGGNTYSESVDFDVQKPTAAAQTATGTVQLSQSQINGDLILEAGSPQTGQGFSELASVQMPAGFSAGQWTFLQVVTSFETIHSDNKSYYNPDNANPALDVAVAFTGGSNGNIMNLSHTNVSNVLLPTDGTQYVFFDSPSDDLDAAHTVVNGNGTTGYGPPQQVAIDGETRNDSYETYVMFKPPGANSVWVPLKVVDWSWSASVSVVNKNPNGSFVWGFNSSANPTAGAATDATDPPYDWYKQWTESWLQS